MRSTTAFLCSLSLLAPVMACGGHGDDDDVGTSAEAIKRGEGAESFTTSGSIDLNNPFFRVFGTNGRTCATCHDGRVGWTITPELARRVFDESDGLAPLFRAVDETVRPDSDLSTREAREAAFAMLLAKGVTRFTRTIKPTAEFEVAAVSDPYGWSTPAAFTNFRRIIATSNQAHQSSVTWTGGPADVATNLAAVFVGGTKLHGETTVTVSAADAAAAASFMMSLSFAQIVDKRAGRLDAAGATGGAKNLAAEPFYIGINALGGDSRTGAAFDNESFEVYSAWEDVADKDRARIARGEEAFYTIDIAIRDVPGINDALGQTVVQGHCTTCHNTPNVGSHSEFRMIDLGLTGTDRYAGDVPLVTLRNKSTGELRQTSDVGRALSSGKWTDIGRFKVPTLRGVGVRAPYFHDGSAKNLHEVLDFYEARFGIDFKGAKEDIVLFLQAL
jgi:cytochrome c peroxidase